MPRQAVTPAANPAATPQGEVQLTEIRKSVVSAASAALKADSGVEPEESNWISIDEWLAKFDAPTRERGYVYYIYRVDPNIKVTRPIFDEEGHHGSYTYRFKAEELAQLWMGSFVSEVQEYVKEHFGGGTFRLQINDAKVGNRGRAVTFKIDGPPKLSERESYVNGCPSPAPLGSDQSQLLPYVMKLIDEKLSAVSQNRQDPNVAIQEVTKALMEAHSGAYKWLMESMPKPEDATKQLEQMKLFFELFKQMQPPASQAAALNPMETVRQTLELMKLLRETDRPAGPDTAAAIREAVTAAVAGMAGKNRGGTDWTALIEAAKAFGPVLQTALAPVGMALAERIRSAPIPSALPSAPGAGRAPVKMPTAAVGVRAAGGPVAAGGNLQPVPPQPPAPAPPAASEPSGAVTDEVVSAVKWNVVATQLADMLTHDVPGNEAAAALERFFPEFAVRMRGVTPAMITMQIGQDPILSQVKDDPRLPGFLESFVEWLNPPADDDDEKPTNPAKLN
jgi:hypothetical protein